MSDVISTVHRQMPLGRHLAILTKMYYGALSKRLEHLEIEKHYSVLVFISNQKGPCNQQFLCDSLMIDKATMVSTMDYLEKKKFLKRKTSAGDRRSYSVELTPKAMKVMPEIQREIETLNKRALKGLTKEEATVFKEALCLISGNLNAEPATQVVIKYKKVKKSNESR